MFDKLFDKLEKELKCVSCIHYYTCSLRQFICNPYNEIMTKKLKDLIKLYFVPEGKYIIDLCILYEKREAVRPEP
jgi:hypothetical protein